jgi:hypothetical protein
MVPPMDAEKPEKSDTPVCFVCRKSLEPSWVCTICEKAGLAVAVCSPRCRRVHERDGRHRKEKRRQAGEKQTL